MSVSPVSDTAIDEAIASVRRKFAMKPKVAVAGFGKSGKSSLFNAIYGQKVASVSMRTDETQVAQTAEAFGIDFTDTPGIGTGKFSLAKVVEMGVFDRQHIVIHVLNGASAISSDDDRLHEHLERASARRVTVVNKVDILDEQEQAEYADSLMEKLGLRKTDFLFVSAKHGTNVKELVRHIADVLPDAMQDAFIAEQQASLELKEKRIRALIYSKAVICGAVGATPIPVADIFVISPIQASMIAAIGFFHGVEVTRERALELIAVLGAGVGLREVARQLVKLVPGWGSVMSAGIAFAGTCALGEAANFWFKNKMKVDADDLKAVFEQAAGKAKEAYEQRTEDAHAREIAERVREIGERLERGDIGQDEYERLLAAVVKDAV